jgi:hypothetical protein
MQNIILPGTFIKSRENLNEFIRKGTVLRITEVITHRGSKFRNDDLIATTYVCKYEDPRVTIKIKLFDFIIEPSGQENEATIYPITRQGWKIIAK